MFTQTHLLVSTALFARPGNRAVATAAILGALLPDADVWIMFVVERAHGVSGCEIFHFRYWEPPWTTLQMIVNSIPAYLLLALIGFVGVRWSSPRLRVIALPLLVFALSALGHVISDFLLHHDDARAQWMPFSDWIFRSPVSYWDPAYFGNVFKPFEITLGLSLIFMIGRRFRTRWIWAVLLALSLGYSGSLAAGSVSSRDHPRGPGSCDDFPTRWPIAAPAQISSPAPNTE